jgi:hypothetical protein
MSRWLKAVWDNTDNITKWLQIVALIVAGYWAYTRFRVGEAPSLEPRLGIGTQGPNIYPGPTQGTCHVQTDVVVSNDGKTSFDLKSVHLEVFHSNLPQPSDRIRAPLDERVFEEPSNRLFEGDVLLPLLLRHYAPGDHNDQTMSWIIRNQPNQIYLIKITANAIDKHGHTLSAVSGRWGWGWCIASQGTAANN